MPSGRRGVGVSTGERDPRHRPAGGRTGAAAAVPQQRTGGSWPAWPRGLADHLGVDVLVVRLAFVLLAAAGGAGVATYGLFWVFAPQNPYEAEAPRDRERDLTMLLALGSLTVGGLLLLSALGMGLRPGLAVPLVAVGIGVSILWRQADDDARARWRAATGTHRFSGAARAAVGIALVAHRCRGDPRPGEPGRHDGRAGGRAGRRRRAGAGEQPVVGADGPRPRRRAQRADPRAGARRGRRARARLGAAHADPDPAPRRRPARGGPAGPRPGARAARLALPARAGRDAGTSRPRWSGWPPRSRTRTASPIEVVVVGDCAARRPARAPCATRPGRRWSTRRSTPAGAPCRSTRRSEPEQVTVFVRDRGPGFDPDAVPEDRLGLRQSVVGRMDRHGGTRHRPLLARRRAPRCSSRCPAR